jgi:thioredoxin-dependent peroxiredoxin
MIDPPKATKGRRMSKKTRKKTPKKTTKAASARTVRAQSVTSTKKLEAPTRRAKAGKSGKKSTGKTGKAIGRTSQKAPSKQLKSSGSRRPTQSQAAAVRPADNPSASKSPVAPNHPPVNRQPGLSEGAKAPAFRLPRDGGGTVSPSDYSGKKLVLFFYPRADTPGCTKEAIDFTRLSSAFAEIQTAVLGVSADPPRAQEAFRDKHQLATPLVSDEQHQMLEAYGVWGEKSMYGKTFHGVLRTTVLIGANGRILKIWRNVKVDGHADQVLAEVRAL